MTVKTNSKTIREKKAAREAKDGRSPRHKLLDETLSKVGKPLTATIGERIPKQLHIPGTAPKVHKDIESKGDAYQEALARKRTSDTRVEEAKALLIATVINPALKGGAFGGTSKRTQPFPGSQAGQSRSLTRQHRAIRTALPAGFGRLDCPMWNANCGDRTSGHRRTARSRVAEPRSRSSSSMSRPRGAPPRPEGRGFRPGYSMKERKVSTYRYQDVEIVLKVGSDQIKVRELDKLYGQIGAANATEIWKSLDGGLTWTRTQTLATKERNV